MYGIVVAAVNSALVFIFRGVVLKTVLFFGLYYVVSGLIAYVSAKLPTADLDGLFNDMPDFFMYFFQVFEGATGFSMLLSAWILRFMIRRVPVIG